MTTTKKTTTSRREPPARGPVANALSPRWDNAADASLRRLADEGHSARAIAELIGVTRNAVIGRARRLSVSIGGGSNLRAVAKTPPAAAPAARSGRYFTEAEDDVIRRMGPTSYASDVAEALPGRTPEAVRKRAAALGVSLRSQGGIYRMRSADGTLTPPPPAALERAAARSAAMTTAPSETSATAVNLFAARVCQCRWPLWPAGAPMAERDVCGAAVVAAGKPYCAPHAARSAGRFVAEAA